MTMSHNYNMHQKQCRPISPNSNLIHNVDWEYVPCHQTEKYNTTTMPESTQCHNNTATQNSVHDDKHFNLAICLIVTFFETEQSDCLRKTAMSKQIAMKT